MHASRMSNTHLIDNDNDELKMKSLVRLVNEKGTFLHKTCTFHPFQNVGEVGGYMPPCPPVPTPMLYTKY